MKEFAVSVAKLAGAYLLEHFRNDSTLLLERGSSKEVTTQYDKESDRIIVNEIVKQYPRHNILAEESGKIENGDEYTWIVDSLDGSGNFASGNPFFSVSLALVKNDELVIGVVYAPFLGELYVAERGKGATLNGKPLNVSGVKELAQSYIVTCEGNDRSHVRIAQVYSSLLPRVKDYRKIGSAALECCMVAAGRADGYLTFGIEPWDVAAGILIAGEAGAAVTDFSGKPWPAERSDLIVTNGHIHEPLRDVVR